MHIQYGRLQPNGFAVNRHKYVVTSCVMQQVTYDVLSKNLHFCLRLLNRAHVGLIRAHNVHNGRENKKVIYSSDKNSPWFLVFEIHEWIRETVHLEEQDVLNIQEDGQMRQVYIKLGTGDIGLNIQDPRTGII
jgi:hypothetical protein